MAKKSINEKNRKVVVIGHTGFIGQSLVVNLRNMLPVRDVLTPPRLNLSNMEEATQLAPWFTPDATLILCAAIKKQYGDSLDTYSANQRISENLCRLIAAHPPARIVYFSSASVYGEDKSNLAISEDTPVNPSAWYGLEKVASEKLLQKTVQNTPSSLAILRPPLIYGAGDKSRGYGPTGFIWNAIHNQGKITLWGGGEEYREFLYIEDAAKIVSGLVKLDYTGVVNLATGTSHTFREALDYVAKITPVSITKQSRSKTKVDQAYNNNLLKTLLPGLMFTSLESGITQTFSDLVRMDRT